MSLLSSLSRPLDLPVDRYIVCIVCSDIYILCVLPVDRYIVNTPSQHDEDDHQDHDEDDDHHCCQQSALPVDRYIVNTPSLLASASLHFNWRSWWCCCMLVTERARWRWWSSSRAWWWSSSREWWPSSSREWWSSSSRAWWWSSSLLSAEREKIVNNTCLLSAALLNCPPFLNFSFQTSLSQKTS